MWIQRVSLRQLRVFEMVAAQGSFSRAAKQMHMTQPGVSMHLRELESQTGVALFERLGRRLELTEAGRELLGRAREVLRALDAAEEALDALKGLRRGHLEIAVVSTAKYFAPRLLASFRAKYPETEIRLAVSNRSQVIELLTTNSVDLAIMGRAPESLNVTAVPFAEHPHVVIAAVGHPLAADRAIDPTRFLGERFIAREPGSGTRLAMEQFFRERRLAIRIDMEMASNETIKQAVMAGMGLSFISRHTIDLEVATARIAVLDVRGLPVVRHWHVTHLANKRLTPLAEEFKRYALAEGPALLAATVP